MYLGYVALDGVLYDARETREMRAISRVSADSSPMSAAIQPSAQSAPSLRERPEPGALIGRLEIPGVGIESFVAAGTQDGQSTYDLRTYREWFEVPNLKMHPALIPFYAVNDDADWESDRVKELMRDASPITHLTKDDAPVFMTYGRGDVPVDENSDPGLWVHHVRLGDKLKEAMDRHGIECHVVSPGKQSDDHADLHEFLARKVKGEPDPE